MSICWEDGCTCIDHLLLGFIEKGENDEAKSILQNLENSLHLTDNLGSTLLHYSTKYGNAAIAQYLIEHGLDVNVQDDTGITPLMLAVTNKNLIIVELLLNSNADIYLASYHGSNALQYAVYSRFSYSSSFTCLKQKSHVIMKMFFDKVNKDFLSKKDETLQFLLNADKTVKLAAVAIASAEVAKFILKNGYTINRREQGSQALYWAMRFGKPKNVELLIEREVDIIQAVRGFGYDYNRNIVQVDEKAEILKIWLKYMAIRWTTLNEADRMHVKRELENLLKFGTKESVRTIIESDICMAAMKSSPSQTLSRLLFENENEGVFEIFENFDFRIDVNKVNSYGQIALLSAAYFGHVKHVEYLLKHGADVTLLWTQWKFELYTAAIYNRIDAPDKENNFAKIAEILLQYGVDVQLDFCEIWSIIDNFVSLEIAHTLKIILAHLALLGALDKPMLTAHTRILIESKPKFKSHFELCTQHLEQMKNIQVSGTLSLFKLLVEDDRKLMVYARNTEFISAFNSAIRQMSHLDSYHINVLQRRMAKASENIELVIEAASAMQNLTRLCCDVIYEIFSFLSFQDLNSLSKV